jgi:hypothetical protein
MKILHTYTGFRRAELVGIVVKFEECGKQYSAFVDFFPRAPLGELVGIDCDESQTSLNLAQVRTGVRQLVMAAARNYIKAHPNGAEPAKPASMFEKIEKSEAQREADKDAQWQELAANAFAKVPRRETVVGRMRLKSL